MAYLDSYNNHTNRYNQVQQFYSDDHDNRRNRRNRNDRGTYAPSQMPFGTDVRELPSQKISVSIRLSNTQNINIDSLISALSRNYDLNCDLAGNVLTVAGYPGPGSSCDAANDFLATVKSVSGDDGAYIVG